MTDIFSIISGIMSGLLGAMGMGGGGILIICLTVFNNIPQQLAQGINLIFFIPIAILSVIIYSFKKLIVWKTAIPFAIFGIIGSIIGVYISYNISPVWLGRIFGILLLFMGIKELFSRNKEPKH